MVGTVRIMTAPGPTAAPAPTGTVSRTVDVAASPEQVWALVSDLPSMGAYSPENTGGSWQGGAVHPEVGAVFLGKNAQGKKTWSTRSTVTRCDPGREFAFEVKAVGLTVAEWSYALRPAPQGCAVTETWTDRRGAVIRMLGKLTTGVGDREGFTATSIEQTLAKVKDRAEQV